jgi:hypothetical protein
MLPHGRVTTRHHGSESCAPTWTCASALYTVCLEPPSVGVISVMDMPPRWSECAWRWCAADSLGRRPPLWPRARAATRPATPRSRMSARSHSAKAPSRLKSNVPSLVAVSRWAKGPSRTRTLICRSCNSAASSIQCSRERAKRSRRQTTSVWPGGSALRQAARPGRACCIPEAISS